MKSALKSLLLLAAAASLSAHALAIESSTADRCDAGLGLTLTQHREIRQLEHEAAIQLRISTVEVKLIKEHLAQLMTAVNATKEEAIAVRAALAEKIALIRVLKDQKDLAIAFDILSPEQRVRKERCLERIARGPQHVPTYPRRVGPPPVRHVSPLPHRSIRVERRRIPAPRRHPRQVVRPVIVRR